MSGPAGLFALSRPLERLAFPAARSRGRRYPEPGHPYRGEFQRDRDRIVHSRAFRRLEDKTQVFGSGASDHFRNRLTHTIEVAQIARTVADALGLNEDLTEALALVHDVGHPPFAHAGEAELNLRMQSYGDSFDHNVHGLRVVDAFEQRYARFPGLNLTFEVREGILKHSRDLPAAAPPEFAEFRPGEMPPLEAQLIDLADEIAYNTADLDDGYSAGMFSLATVRSDVTLVELIAGQIEGQFPGAPERLQFQEVLRSLIDQLVSGLIVGTRTLAEEAGASDFEAVRSAGHRLAAFVAMGSEATVQLKTFLRKHVYYTEPLVSERRRSARMIGELFRFLVEHPDRMPANYSEEVGEQPTHRVVCDYIAGMTDGFFLRCYRQCLGEPA